MIANFSGKEFYLLLILSSSTNENRYLYPNFQKSELKYLFLLVECFKTQLKKSHPHLFISILINVLVAEDHNLVRNGIISLLERDCGINVVGEAVNGNEVLQKIKEGFKPDIVITDLNMPELN